MEGISFGTMSAERNRMHYIDTAVDLISGQVESAGHRIGWPVNNFVRIFEFSFLSKTGMSCKRGEVSCEVVHICSFFYTLSSTILAHQLSLKTTIVQSLFYFTIFFPSKCRWFPLS